MHAQTAWEQCKETFDGKVVIMSNSAGSSDDKGFREVSEVWVKTFFSRKTDHTTWLHFEIGRSIREAARGTCD